MFNLLKLKYNAAKAVYGLATRNTAIVHEAVGDGRENACNVYRACKAAGKGMYKSLHRLRHAENGRERLKEAAKIGAIGAVIYIADEAVEHFCDILSPDDFMDTRIFSGSEADLEKLISMGELPDTEHVENVTRSHAAVRDFLQSIELDSIPERYEVHHIIPLSEGGPDTTDNMILVDKATHAVITAQHNEYYGWHRL